MCLINCDGFAVEESAEIIKEMDSMRAAKQLKQHGPPPAVDKHGKPLTAKQLRKRAKNKERLAQKIADKAAEAEAEAAEAGAAAEQEDEPGAANSNASSQRSGSSGRGEGDEGEQSGSERSEDSEGEEEDEENELEPGEGDQPEELTVTDVDDSLAGDEVVLKPTIAPAAESKGEDFGSWTMFRAEFAVPRTHRAEWSGRAERIRHDCAGRLRAAAGAEGEG